jgi:hypothetical protein
VTAGYPLPAWFVNVAPQARLTMENVKGSAMES